MVGVGGFDASIRGTSTAQTFTANRVDQAKIKPIDQQVSSAGVASLQLMKADVTAIKEDKDITFHGGSSPSQATCRHLRDVTKHYVAAHNVFSTQQVLSEGSLQATKGAVKFSDFDQKLTSEQLPQTLSVVAAKVEKGEVDSKGGAFLLHFGKHELGLLKGWEKDTTAYINRAEKRLSTANPAEKTALEAGLKEAKGKIGEIRKNIGALTEGVGKLENAITSKHGKDALDVTIPSLPHNTSQVYRIIRLK